MLRGTFEAVWVGLSGWHRRYCAKTASRLARRPSDLADYQALVTSRISAGDRVLHLGCGWDRSGMARMLIPRCRVVGVDADAHATARFPGEGWEARAEQLPFADGSFDAVIAEYVFEHLEHPDRMMAEASRVLRPGGSLVALTPNRWSYKSLLAAATPMALHALAAATLRPDARTRADVYPTWYRANSFIALHELAAVHGFCVEDLRYCNNGPTWFQRIPGLFEAGLVVHAAMDRLRWLEHAKCGIIVVMRRPKSLSSEPDTLDAVLIRCLDCGRDDMRLCPEGYRCSFCDRVYPRAKPKSGSGFIARASK